MSLASHANTSSSLVIGAMTTPETYVMITIAIRLRYDYDPTTTYRARLLPFDAIRREQKMNMSIFRHSLVVVASQSNGTHIVISITSVVVECVVISSYRSRTAIVTYA